MKRVRVLVLLTLGCGGVETELYGATPTDAAVLLPDGGAPFDAGTVSDAGSTVDAGRPDAGTPDAGIDAGRPSVDAGFDAGTVGRPTSDGGFTVVNNLAYTGGAAHGLDLFLPSGPGPYPLIVYIHGGAWLEGDKNEFVGLWRAEAARGYAVASLDYRLVPSIRWPGNIQDVKAAVRWLRAHAATYRLDASRFAAWGASAGGHLASVLATSSGVAALEDVSQGNSGQSSAVQALVGWYGPSDFLQMDAQTVSQCSNEYHNDPGSPESQLVNCAIQSCPDAVARANPITYVDATDPPALLMHGQVDCTVPPGQSQIFHDALRSHGVRSTLVLLPRVGHNFGDNPPPGVMDQVHTFLDSTFYP